MRFDGEENPGGYFRKGVALLVFGVALGLALGAVLGVFKIVMVSLLVIATLALIFIGVGILLDYYSM